MFQRVLRPVPTFGDKTRPLKHENRQPVELANIALLTSYSTFVQGTCSGADGTFEIVPATPAGKWLIQISCIGYETLYRIVKNGIPETSVQHSLLAMPTIC